MNTDNKQFATNIVLDDDYESTFMLVKNIVLYSISANITGAPTGTLTLEACVDPATNPTATLSNLHPVNWATIENSNKTVTTAGVNIWNVRDPGYTYVRVVYVDASGGASTATMNLVFNGKGI